MKKSVAVLAVAMFLLVGCRDDDSLTGCRWTHTIEGITITRQFYDDGTISEWINNVMRYDGVYTVEGNEISVTMTTFTNEENGRKMDLPYDVDWRLSYSIKGDRLTLVDLDLDGDEGTVFIRE